MKQITKIILAVLFLLTGLSILVSLAAPLPAAAQAFDIKLGIVGNLPAACKNQGNCTMCDFVGLFVVLQKVILSIFAGLALTMLIWGGQGMIMAAGNQEKFAAGRKIITSTLFGILIILAAYFLVSVLYSILVTPRGQPLKTALTKEWWRNTLGCKAPNDSDFCKENADGTPCSYKVVSGICEGGVCKETACVSPLVCQNKSEPCSGTDFGQKNCGEGKTCCAVAVPVCLPPNACQEACTADKDLGERNCGTGKKCCRP